MKKYFIILFMFLISCSLKRENNYSADLTPIIIKDVYFDQDFSNDEQNNIKYGMKEWFIATRGMVQLNYVGTIKLTSKDPYALTKNVIIRMPSDDPFALNMKNNQTHGANVIGFHVKTDDGDHFAVGIIYDLIPNSTQYKLNVIHELGHAIDLQHIDSGPAILNSIQDKNLRCLTLVDMQNFCNKYSCNANEMNYCSNYNLINQMFN